jgi:hypothetical protein
MDRNTRLARNPLQTRQPADGSIPDGHQATIEITLGDLGG